MPKFVEPPRNASQRSLVESSSLLARTTSPDAKTTYTRKTGKYSCEKVVKMKERGTATYLPSGHQVGTETIAPRKKGQATSEQEARSTDVWRTAASSSQRRIVRLQLSKYRRPLLARSEADVLVVWQNAHTTETTHYTQQLWLLAKSGRDNKDIIALFFSTQETDCQW